MNKSKKFSREVRERAVRMMREHRREYPSLLAAASSIAPKIGPVPQTLLDVAPAPGGRCRGTEAQRVKDLEREVKERAGPTRP